MSTTYQETFISRCPQILYLLMGGISFVSSKSVKPIKSYTGVLEASPTFKNCCLVTQKELLSPSKFLKVSISLKFHPTGLFHEFSRALG
jgi:hypothetical protein